MSATEIIDEIQRLSAADQDRVLAFLQKVHSEREEGARADASYADDADFERSAAKVLREHAGLFRRLAQ